jgi:two-component system, sensor histidine kinase and response regulator
LPRVLLSSSMYRRAEEAEPGLFAVQLLKPVRQQQLHAALGRALSGVRAESRALREPAGGGERLADRLPLRVLVVDDVEVNRRLALALLRGLGYAADSVETGARAVALARGYDLMLMDVQMPDLDGLEATRRIRADTGSAGPRIVAMTASALAGDRERCLAAGMDDYLSKPISPQTLRAALERAAGADAIDWSRTEALKPYDDDGSLVLEVIEAFLQDAPREEAAMRAALRDGDAAKLAAAAHALKGAAVNVGATAVGERCSAIEALAMRGGLGDAAQAIEQLEAGVQAARRAFARRAL